MADRISKKQRSENMTAVKSRGNKSTELKFVALLKENKISGWRRHYKRLIGTPDFAFPKQKVAVFIDGCFWHGCRKCYVAPKSNVAFWKNKIEKNRQRDGRVSKVLKQQGWSVVRIKEHLLKRSDANAVRAVQKFIK